MEDIAAERKKIDALDRKLLRIVSRRLAVARRIGVLKVTRGKRVVDRAREKEVRLNWRANAKASGVPVRDAMAVLRALLAMSKTEQKKVKR